MSRPIAFMLTDVLKQPKLRSFLLTLEQKAALIQQQTQKIKSEAA